MTNDISIATHNLTKLYGQDVRALDGVSISIARGEFLAVMGPSGSGKSTLLNLLGALDRPTKGQILIDGQDMARIKDLDGFRAQSVGFVFQMHNLIPTLNALENVEVPMQGQVHSKRKRRQRARDILKLVSLDDRSSHLPSQLSGGQRQRVAIARSLANQPAVILADEPTGNLDSDTTEVIYDIMRKINSQFRTTFIIITHDRKIAEKTDRIVEIRDGRISLDVARAVV